MKVWKQKCLMQKLSNKFRTIYYSVLIELANIYGEPEVLKGMVLEIPLRWQLHPTTSSSAILGQTSPGIEPFASNYYKSRFSEKEIS